MKAGAWASSSRLPWDSPFSIIKPRVAEASMNLESVRNHMFYCAKLIEASSRLYRGFIEAFENYWFYNTKLIEASSRLHRGFQKLLVLQYKIHRGFIEAFKSGGRWMLTTCVKASRSVCKWYMPQKATASLSDQSESTLLSMIVLALVCSLLCERCEFRKRRTASFLHLRALE